MSTRFEPIETASSVENGTVADLIMKNGRLYRAVWEQRGRVWAWWPLLCERKQPFGLYDPVTWRVVRGVSADKTTIKSDIEHMLSIMLRTRSNVS